MAARKAKPVFNVFSFDPGTNLVDVYVQRVRKKLGGSDRPALIETVRGVGYRMVMDPPAG